MKTNVSTLVCFVTMAALVSTGSLRAAPAKQTAVKVADAIIVRPIALTATLAGGALFALSLPVTALTKTVKPTADMLVVKPAHATFKRPLGDMDALGD
jgi:hypothetical protein